MPRSTTTTNIHYVKKIELNYEEHNPSVLKKFFVTKIIATDANGSEFEIAMMSDEKIEVKS